MGMRRTTLSLLLPLLIAPLGLFSCRAVEEGIDPTPPGELDLWTDAAAGIDDADLAALVTEAWNGWLQAHPIEASLLGDPRFDGQLPQVFQNAVHNRTSEIGELRAALSQLPVERLSKSDLLNRELLDQELEEEEARLELGLYRWQVDPLRGPHILLYDLASKASVRTAIDRAHFAERWARSDTYLRQIGQNLGASKRRGLIANHTSVTKTIQQLESMLAGHPMDTPMVRAAAGGGKWVVLEAGGSVARVAHEYLGDSREQRLLRTVNLHLQDGARIIAGTRVLLPAADDPLTPEERGEFLNAVLLAVEEHLYPGLTEYRDVLVREILPASRSDDRPGLSYVPGGDAAYRTLIREFTSLPAAECDPRAIHEYGLAEVARIRAEIADLGGVVFGTRDVSEIQKRMRTDPKMHFRTRDEVTAKANEALSRARNRIPAYFGLLPETECEVVPIPAFAERDTTTAYYNQPDADGMRPGRYFVNTYAPETRPRYEAEVLAFHESVPGHHLQIALQQELGNLPRFRRHQGSEAFVEGWALYTERLCEEMGLYSSDTDRLGLLSFDAWRASRLVVDTGIHAFGWSRDQAIEYLYDNTLLSAANVENEVDRYIAWPGQALAYKIGQREILALRDHARRVQGSVFSYPRFHDRILGQGAVSLPVLRRVIGEWLRSPVPGAPQGG